MSRHTRAASPPGRRFADPARSSTGTLAPSGYRSRESSLSSRVIPISQETYVNGQLVNSSRGNRNSLDAYGITPRRAKDAESLPRQHFANNSSDHRLWRPDEKPRATAPSSSVAKHSLTPAVIQRHDRPVSPGGQRLDDRYITPATSGSRREHKKIYSIEDNKSRQLQAQTRPRQDSYDPGPRGGAIHRAARQYHANGPTSPRASQVSDYGAYEYTDPRGMYNDTQPIRRERPRRGSLDAVSRPRPTSLIDPYGPESRIGRDIGPPPTTRGLDRIKDVPTRHNSLLDTPRRSPPRVRDRGYDSYNEDDNYHIPPRQQALPAEPYYPERNQFTSPVRENFDDRHEFRRAPRSNRYEDADVASRGFGIRAPSADSRDESIDRKQNYGADPAPRAATRRDDGRDLAREEHRRDRDHVEDDRLKARSREQHNDRDPPRERDYDDERRHRDRERDLPPRRRDEDDHRDDDRRPERKNERAQNLERDRERRDKNHDDDDSPDNNKHHGGGAALAGVGAAGAAAFGIKEAYDRRRRDGGQDEGDKHGREEPRDRGDVLRRTEPRDERIRDDRTKDERPKDERPKDERSRDERFRDERPKDGGPKERARDEHDLDGSASERRVSDPPDGDRRPRHYVKKDDPDLAHERKPESRRVEIPDADEEYRRRVQQEVERFKNPRSDEHNHNADNEHDRNVSVGGAIPPPARNPREKRAEGNSDETTAPAINPRARRVDGIANDTQAPTSSARGRYVPDKYKEDERHSGEENGDDTRALVRHEDNERDILDKPMTGDMAEIIENRDNRVRIVEPPKEKEAPKGILRKPTQRFPEHPNSIREGVAPLKDAKNKDIPVGARWTRIDRRLVNPDALKEAQERYEERQDCVIVLRVLTKEEIQKFADRTKAIRGMLWNVHIAMLLIC